MTRRIAYYHHRYPVVTETFIRREVTALQEAGIQIEFIADHSDPPEVLDASARRCMQTAYYIRPFKVTKTCRALLFFLCRRPHKLVSAFRKVAQTDYSRFKSSMEDRVIFVRALLVAHRIVEARLEHVHAPWAYINAFVALVAADIAGVTFSLQARAFEIHTPSDMHALDEKFRSARFVVTNTQYNARHLRTLLSPSVADKVRVIYNGLDLPALPQRNGRHNGRSLRILTVARLVEQKGLIYLLQALHQMQHEKIPFTASIIGGPFISRYAGYYDLLIQEHERLGLGDRVVFAGAQPHDRVVEAFRDADIFVLPCVVEKSGNRDIIPNAILEAFAMGVPVISTPVGGIPEMIDDGENGILIPPRDVDAIVAAVRRLWRDEPLRTQLAERGRERVEEQFDIRKNIKSYVELFSSLN